MKKVRFLLLSLLFSFVMVQGASADLVYSVSDYATGSAGIISGGSNKPEICVQNLNGDAIVAAIEAPDVGSKFITCNRDSWGGTGDTNQIYSPYSGSNWNKQPEAEFVTKYTEGTFAGKHDFNAHGFLSDDDKLFVAYYGNTYSYFGIDYSSKVVILDMSNNFSKLKEYNYKPEEKDPAVAAQLKGILEYEGYIYAVYSVFRKGDPTDQFGAAGYVADPNATVVKLTKDLEFVSEVNFKGKQLSSYVLLPETVGKGKLLLCSYGGGSYDAEISEDSCISIVDLNTMTSSTPVSVKSLKDSGTPIITAFRGAASDLKGNIYILTMKFNYMGQDPNDPHPDDYKDNKMHRMSLYRTTLTDLEKGKVGELIHKERFFGDGADIAFDAQTGYLWYYAENLFRYDVNSGERISFDAEAIKGKIYNIDILKREESSVVAPIIPDNLSDDITEKLEAVTASKELTAEDVIAKTGDNFNKEDIREKTGYVTVSEKLVSDIVSKDLPGITENEITPLPIFTSTLSDETKTAMISFSVKGREFGETNPSKIKIYKIISNVESKRYEYSSSIAGEMSGKFTIQDFTGRIVSGEMDSDVTYILSVYINDNSGFDLNSIKGTVTDPLAIVRPAKPAAKPDPTPETTGGSGGGSGGCNAGFAGMLLLGLVPAFIFRKKD